MATIVRGSTDPVSALQQGLLAGSKLQAQRAQIAQSKLRNQLLERQLSFIDEENALQMQLGQAELASRQLTNENAAFRNQLEQSLEDTTIAQAEADLASTQAGIENTAARTEATQAQSRNAQLQNQAALSSSLATEDMTLEDAMALSGQLVGMLQQMGEKIEVGDARHQFLAENMLSTARRDKAALDIERQREAGLNARATAQLAERERARIFQAAQNQLDRRFRAGENQLDRELTRQSGESDKSFRDKQLRVRSLDNEISQLQEQNQASILSPNTAFGNATRLDNLVRQRQFILDGIDFYVGRDGLPIPKDDFDRFVESDFGGDRKRAARQLGIKGIK